MYNVLSAILSWCECERNKIEFDPETIEVLRAIYDETNPDNETEDEDVEESDSEDSDYEPEKDVDDDASSEEEDSDDEEETGEVSEQIIIRKDENGHYYIY
jgi:predicted  nucleic acid-binding Zn-ribbon protein